MFLPGFSCRDLIVVSSKRRLVASSAYLSYYSEDSPPSMELEEILRYRENENFCVNCGGDSNAHHTAWVAPTAIIEGGPSGISISTKLEILNQGSVSTFCSGSRQEVIHITLGTFGLLESITGLEVSLEPSLSDHRHILFTLRDSVPLSLIRNLRCTNWSSFPEALR